MRYLFTMCLLASLFCSACVKGDRKNTKYKIEASSTGTITAVYYSTRDHGPQQVLNYNSSTWEYEWDKGYKRNEIKIMVECTGTTTVKIYRKGDVVSEDTGTSGVNASWEGDSN